ncbi:hypothetical protein GKC29_05200 [Micromonospora sp. WMMC415]|uniref:hypothetical protein n=1 Tax=Micromonospora sp. WMMC415 TaxID=2675222 RepID=UPI0012B4EAAD|nr:hypothetical protein [Micromonospora sp. WMMC415]QGN46294.1 hypothetical protein GKC29_05200 [Micromonospora sp. WMMC415]
MTTIMAAIVATQANFCALAAAGMIVHATGTAHDAATSCWLQRGPWGARTDPKTRQPHNDDGSHDGRRSDGASCLSPERER